MFSVAVAGRKSHCSRCRDKNRYIRKGESYLNASAYRESKNLCMRCVGEIYDELRHANAGIIETIPVSDTTPTK